MSVADVDTQHGATSIDGAGAGTVDVSINTSAVDARSKSSAVAFGDMPVGSSEASVAIVRRREDPIAESWEQSTPFGPAGAFSKCNVAPVQYLGFPLMIA